MSEPENFLARWSRKKIEADSTNENVANEQDTPPAEQAAGEGAAASAPAADAPPEIDPATLPPIESIGAGTDIRAFLQAGVPSDLTRAALRRVWTTDPNIRDFIGIAENQWDFTDPNGVPGFGPLKAVDDVRRMVAEIMGETPRVPEPEPAKEQTATISNDSKSSPEPVEGDAPIAQASAEQNALPPAPAEPPDEPVTVSAALQQESDEQRLEPVPTRRPHGRALPQ